MNNDCYAFNTTIVVSEEEVYPCITWRTTEESCILFGSKSEIEFHEIYGYHFIEEVT